MESGKDERPQGRRMSREEFIERMQRDTIRRQTDPEGTTERRERAEAEEQERRKRQEADLNAYRSRTIGAYLHKLHRKDPRAKIRGPV